MHGQQLVHAYCILHTSTDQSRPDVLHAVKQGHLCKGRKKDVPCDRELVVLGWAETASALPESLLDCAAEDCRGCSEGLPRGGRGALAPMGANCKGGSSWHSPECDSDAPCLTETYTACDSFLSWAVISNGSRKRNPDPPLKSQTRVARKTQVMRHTNDP